LEILLSIATLALGMALLVKGADFFLNGSVKLARHFGVSELIISLTLVSIATTMPEIAVSLTSVFNNEPGLAVSNLIGTTMFNTCLLVGIVAHRRTIKIHQKVIDRDCLALILSYLVLLLAFGFGGVTQWLGVVLIVAYAGYLLFLYQHVKTEKLKRKKQKGLKKDLSLMSLGIIGVYVGSNLAVTSAETIICSLGVGEWLVGALLLGGGTSLPELTVAFHSIKKKKGAMALGTVIGSNVADLLVGIGASAIFYPLVMGFNQVGIDLCFGLISAVAITLLAVEGEINRKDSYFLIGLFLTYFVYLLSLGG
jgi:cation:H+ antiporter